MKKLLIIFAAFLALSATAFADDNYVALLGKIGFDDKKTVASNPYTEIRTTLDSHLKYSNAYNNEGLSSLYAQNYVNGDGFDKKVYFDLVQKTWKSYPNIKYSMLIKHITVNGNTAIAELEESACATANGEEAVMKNGLLQSFANSIYYLEKFPDGWKITSDSIISEQTFLRYGSARYATFELTTPNQILANTDYTATLDVKAPKNTLVIASIGSEKITYPQNAAEEVFRKLPNDGILERMFKSNSDNINEYAVASVGLTKAEMKGTEIKIYITGLGFAMTRVNVIPQNKFIKAEDETKKSDK